MSLTRAPLPLRHAIALGLLQGPTELLPVSSSAHTTLLLLLAGWPYGELDPTLRKSFEVALHAGAALALLAHRPHDADGPMLGPAALAAALAPPALAGYALGERIERLLGTPSTIAAGLLAGSTAMALGEAASRGRNGVAVGVKDGVSIGIAQALALIPGVSRSGASLAAARARGFSRRDADRLSWQAGLPVLAGASLLQSVRLARSRPPARTTLVLAAGAGASFASTLLSVSALTPKRRSSALGACAGYRVALASLVARRLANGRRFERRPNPKK